MKKLENSHLWYDFAVDYHNNREYIDITELANNKRLSRCCQEYMRLPEVTVLQHFFEKWKIQLILKNEKFVNVFTNLGDFLLNTDPLDVLGEFISHLYGHVRQNDVNEVVILHFQEKTKPNSVDTRRRFNVHATSYDVVLTFKRRRVWRFQLSYCHLVWGATGWRTI